MEIEMKYLVPLEYEKDDLDMDFSDIINIHAFYYDTKDFNLAKNKYSYRIRYENDEVIFTTKYGGSENEGLHKREEINIKVSNDLILNPSIDILKDYDVYNDFRKFTKGKDLVKILEMKFVRFCKNVKFNDSIISFSFDDGYIYLEDKKMKIHEIELELFSGNENDLIDYSKTIEGKYKLVKESKSKLNRGLELIKNW